MTKKAQIAGQVFVFILAAAIAVLIIGYGYKAIMGFSFRTEQIALINFKTDLQTEIRTIASDFGSVKRLDLTMPGTYKQFCLVDLTYTGNRETECLCTYGCQDYQPEVCDAWTTPGNQETAFLIPITTIKLSAVKIENPFTGETPSYLCFSPKGNKISLRLEGAGAHTKVWGWQ